MGIFNTANDTVIRRFLTQFKDIIRTKNYYLVPRVINTEFLIEHGISTVGLELIILQLTVQDYVKGPEPDRNHEDEYIWVFKAMSNNLVIYIKLQLRKGRGWIISVHEDY